MAKISPTSIKYSINADFSAEGPFQKPDVIGALFGQTEGLLGSDMELRELQKEGKIGRIEVELNSEGGKTSGEIVIPSALDKTETTIIAAAIETIDKIGPTDAKITIREIEDVRGSKRDYIMERAKALLAGIKNEGADSVEIGNQLRESSRIAKVVEYGPEKLAAGPEMESSEEIIVVEGRADVVNMLRAGIKNVIGMQGTRFPKTIAELSKTKKITLFVDGDRGGLLIASNVCDNANVEYITTAPDGKEVEELTGKEILQCLRKKVKPSDFLRKSKDSKKESLDSSNFSKSKSLKREKKLDDLEIEKLRSFSKDLKARNILVLDSNLNLVKTVTGSKLASLKEKDVFALLSANATKSLIENAEKLGAGVVGAKSFGKIPETNLELISL